VEPWKTESHEQNEIVLRIVGDAAAAFATAGYFTIIDGIVIPGWFFEVLRDALRSRGIGVSYAVLRPQLSICLDRARRRSGDGLRDATVVEQLWSDFMDLGLLEKHVIENGEDDPGSIAQMIIERLRLGLFAT
jgi:hypothetical protein